MRPILTPLGVMTACATERGICRLEFLDPQTLGSGTEASAKKINHTVTDEGNEHIRQLTQELQEYFEGKRIKFDVPLDPVGSAFQLSVWKSLLDLPYGTTTTYMNQALMLGNPKAVRAVAAANGQNKIAVVVPCHRVIGSNGKLTGYAGGLERKRWLLEFESRWAGKQAGRLF